MDVAVRKSWQNSQSTFCHCNFVFERKVNMAEMNTLFLLNMFATLIDF